MRCGRGGRRSSRRRSRVIHTRYIYILAPKTGGLHRHAVASTGMSCTRGGARGEVLLRRSPETSRTSRRTRHGQCVASRAALELEAVAARVEMYPDDVPAAEDRRMCEGKEPEPSEEKKDDSPSPRRRKKSSRRSDSDSDYSEDFS